MLTPETLKVHILDFTKANAQLTEALNRDNVQGIDPQKYHFDSRYCALIDINNRFILISPTAMVNHPQINDVKNPVLLFELDVYEEFDDKISLKPEGTANLSAADIEQLKTGISISLREFMRENYNSNKEIYETVQAVLNYVNSPAPKNKYLIK